MKSITTRLRQLKSQKPPRIVLLFVLLLLISDVLVAALGNLYLGENSGTLFGSSIKIGLSNLLFIEGAVIFAIGTFIAVAKAMQKTKPEPETSTETALENAEQTGEKRMSQSTLLIVVGAILIVLSIIIDKLPL